MHELPYRNEIRCANAEIVIVYNLLLLVLWRKDICDHPGALIEWLLIRGLGLKEYPMHATNS